MTYPRLLFITSHAFNNVTGGGITFSHLFNGWPQEKLLTVHNDPDPVSVDVCNQYYSLGREFSLFGVHKTTNREAPRILEQSSRSIYTLYVQKLKSFFRKLIFGDSGLPWKFTPSQSLSECLDAYQPEIVYTILGSVPIMQCVRWVCQEYQTKLVIHLMDDWPSALYKTGAFRKINKQSSDSLLIWCINNSQLRLSICDAMSSAFSSRYRVPFKSYRNAVDVKFLKTYLKSKKKNRKEKKRICYVGSVFSFAQSESILDVARAIECLNNKIEIEFHLFVPNSCLSFADELLRDNSKSIVYHQIEKDDKYFQILQDSDILLLASNFTQKSIESIRYSMPTKIPSYLISGTPVLVYGSKETAQVQYALEAGWGYCVIERNDQVLVDAIKKLLFDSDLRELLISNGFETVSSNHDLPVVSAAFQGEFQKVYQGNS